MKMKGEVEDMTLLDVPSKVGRCKEAVANGVKNTDTNAEEDPFVTDKQHTAVVVPEGSMKGDALEVAAKRAHCCLPALKVTVIGLLLVRIVMVNNMMNEVLNSDEE
jgi:hypothetical protein